MARVRYYTYKVTFIDLNDYITIPKGQKIPFFIDYVPVKRNAAEAQLEISCKTKRNLIFLSTVRAKQRKTSSISAVKLNYLTKRHLKTIEKELAKRISAPAPSLLAVTTGTVTAVPDPFCRTVASGFSQSFTVDCSTTYPDTVNTIYPFTSTVALMVVPPAPVSEAPVDPEQDKMTERAEEDDRSVWDAAHPEIHKCPSCDEIINNITHPYPNCLEGPKTITVVPDTEPSPMVTLKADDPHVCGGGETFTTEYEAKWDDDDEDRPITLNNQSVCAWCGLSMTGVDPDEFLDSPTCALCELPLNRTPKLKPQAPPEPVAPTGCSQPLPDSLAKWIDEVTTPEPEPEPEPKKPFRKKLWGFLFIGSIAAAYLVYRLVRGW